MEKTLFSEVKVLSTDGGFELTVSNIQEMAQAAKINELPAADLSRFFFQDDLIVKNRLQAGVVETPEPIAKYMVQLVCEQWQEQTQKKFTSRDFESLHWFDPCTGAGVFPVAILKFYLNNVKPNSISQLPRITISEISPIGLFISLCAIKSTLVSCGFTLDEYLGSGRLSCLMGDTLDVHSEQRKLMDANIAYDVVIGNPPYVRATRLDENYRKKLRRNFPNSFYGAADLYTFFIASGVASLKEGGYLAFISPAAFVRAKSGLSIRNFLTKNSSVEVFLDLDESPVFEDASLHSAIYILKKGSPQRSQVKFLLIRNKSEIDSMCSGQRHLDLVGFEQSGDNGWIFQNLDRPSMLVRKAGNCRPLSELGINVYSGVRPGLMEAFVLTEEEARLFSKETRDVWIKPLALAGDILRWSGIKKLHFLLKVTNDGPRPPEEILAHLSRFKDRLEKRQEVSALTPWYSLRSCKYFDKMEKRKIVFPDISVKQRFSILPENYLVPDGAYFFDTDNLVLLAVLNSSLAREYFVSRCSSVGSLESGGRFRFKKTFVQDFPLPASALEKSALTSDIEGEVKKILIEGETEKAFNELDRLVTKLYSFV